MIRRAEASDVGAIMALELAGFERARWSEASWRAELDGADRCVLVASDDGRLAGVATFSIVADTAELLRVVVAPQARRHGIAASLMDAGAAWAAGRGASEMLLEVAEGNAPAEALYRSAGFAPIARRADYYGPGHHAIVMGRPVAAGQEIPA